jgi:NAD-dependent SIR2 family protein deacetylase
MEHLDGNAAAGDFSEVFTLEATSATATCASCGATGPMARAMLYETGIGTVLRCPDCDSVLMRLVHARGEILMEMRGIKMLRWHNAAG